MKTFYSHLIEVESLIVELDSLDLTPEQKLHLTSIVDSSLHHTILDAILSQLSQEDKIIFLRHLEENNHDKIWQFLNNKVDNIESKVKDAAENLKKELQEDIKKSKEKK
ncbi:hypothetical protein HYS92_03100 [Candidatus Daviesbacteria bacterium]|nr:hypothetical protein [Candidatus Daviesbacteria bacterium]